MNYKISVIGKGYVGCANALMLASNNQVSICEIDKKKVKDFNKGILPINEFFAQEFLDTRPLNISATTNLEESVKDSTFIILALPTNFSSKLKEFDIQIIEEVSRQVISINPSALIVIRSTINIGFTEQLSSLLKSERIIFCPEFLREGKALNDSLNPDRIIIGGSKKVAEKFLNLLQDSIGHSKTPAMITTSQQAESIKLFSNTYLAMRVSFFNELDSFCLDNKIDSKEVIEGVCLDSRIGSFYNNPSFGFGGLCLPKDSLQLLYRFKNSPNDLLAAIQNSNQSRAEHLVGHILSKKPKIVGVYNLAMKAKSDNSRNASIYTLIHSLIEKNIKIIIYDKSIQSLDIKGLKLIDDFKSFVETSDLILANRIDNKILPFRNKIFSRDIFSSD